MRAADLVAVEAVEEVVGAVPVPPATCVALWAVSVVLPLTAAAAATERLVVTATEALPRLTVVALATVVVMAIRLALPVLRPGGKTGVVVSDEAVGSDWLFSHSLLSLAFH